MTPPSSGGRRAAICSPLNPPHDLPMMPTRPVHHGCAASQASTSSASSCSCGRYSSSMTPSESPEPRMVDAHGRIAVAGEPGVHERVAGRRAVVLAVGDVLEDRRHRVGLGVVGQPDAGRQAGAVGERDPGVGDRAHAALEVGADAHPGSFRLLACHDDRARRCGRRLAHAPPVVARDARGRARSTGAAAPARGRCRLRTGSACGSGMPEAGCEGSGSRPAAAGDAGGRRGSGPAPTAPTSRPTV